MIPLRESGTTVEPGAVRSAAAALDRQGATARAAAARVRPMPGWRGPGSESASVARSELAARSRAWGAALAEAAQALRRCAQDLEEAAHLRTRVTALVQEDAQTQRAAERARAVLRAATTTGPPLPPYGWDDGTTLLVAARRYAAEADGLEDEAVRRAAAALDELRPAHRQRRSPTDHVLGFGRGAWDAAQGTVAWAWRIWPAAAVEDPGAWWREVRGVGTGLAFVAQHPRTGAAAALGLDQLEAGAYGEWLGAMAAGALGPPSRGARLLGAGRLVDAGGPVRLRPGVAVPSSFPARIPDLEPDRRIHILDGDHRGGGHRPGTGRPDKSEFPPDWSDDDIIQGVMLTATRPERAIPDRGRFLAYGTHRGVLIKVVLEADGRVVTGVPLGGPGVVRNPRRGEG